MEWGLTYFTEIFKYSSGILIAWGLLAIYSVSSVLKNQYSRRKKVRITDVGFLISVTIITTLMLVLLYKFPHFVSQNMYAIFSLEFWYAIFATYYTTEQIIPWCRKGYFRQSRR
jgi:hypothetical protein